MRRPVESMDLKESDRVTTTMTWRLVFRHKADRNHMTKFDGIEANLDHVEDLPGSLLDPKATVSA